MKEYRDLTADPLQDSITAGPVSEDNMLEWDALIQGPDDTPYEGGVFAAKLVFVSRGDGLPSESSPKTIR
jgi:ubiquitin-conjugating enzyme E2 G2